MNEVGELLKEWLRALWASFLMWLAGFLNSPP